MKFLILNTDYLEFLRWLYAEHPGLERKSYEEQMRARNESLFGVADFYSSNLRKLGHEAWDLHVNNHPMQMAWAREHGGRSWKYHSRWRRSQAILGRPHRLMKHPPFRYLQGLLRPMARAVSAPDYRTLEAQIRHYRPDVVLNQAVDTLDPSFLRQVRRHVPLIVGQIASPFSAQADLSAYDLMISSMPHFVDYFRRRGMAAELHRLAFEPAVLRWVSEGGNNIPVSFVGTVSPYHHTARVGLLEYLGSRFELDVFGQGAESLPETSRIRRRYRGPLWGRAMYQTLRDSRVTLNHHVDVAGRYANNMRLFEATGVGTCLVTDRKDNLAEMFEPGTEVVAYDTADDCAEKIRYLLEHDKERATLASAGQRRTLRQHTYYHRMQELVEIADRYLRSNRLASKVVSST